jgi:AraC-like DNA-binding protein
MSERPLSFADPGRFEIYCHHSPPALYAEETHDTVQICIPFEGARYDVTRHSAGGRNYVHRLSARDVLVVPAEQPHTVAWRRPADILSVQLSRRFMRDALDLPEIEIPDALTLRDPLLTEAAGALRSMLQAGEATPVLFGAFATLIAYRIVKGVSGGIGLSRLEQAAPFPESGAARIRHYIAQHLDRPIQLTELAGLAGLSLWHFTRRFHATEGMSPHAFITERRLQKAEALLAGTDRSILEIALDVGMTHSHFSRTFVRRFGVAPREYRRLQHG